MPAAVASLLAQGSGAATLLRLEGTSLSVGERIALLQRELGGAGVEMEESESKTVWRALRDIAPF